MNPQNRMFGLAITADEETVLFVTSDSAVPEGRRLQGHESHGMILAAAVDNVPIPVLVRDSHGNASVE